eukprot:221869_1
MVSKNPILTLLNLLVNKKKIKRIMICIVIAYIAFKLWCTFRLIAIEKKPTTNNNNNQNKQIKDVSSDTPISFIHYRATLNEINEALALYYKEMNHDYNGWFLGYVAEQESTGKPISLEKEFGPVADVNNCSLITFDHGFPIPDSIVNDTQKHHLIFYVIQHCYQFGRPPTQNYIKDKVFSIQNDDFEVKINDDLTEFIHDSMIDQLTTALLQQSSAVNALKNDNVNKVTQITHFCDQLSNCNHFHQFTKTLNEYNKNNDVVDNINISVTLNDFLHLIEQHDNDEQFKVIVDALEHCDIMQCKIFRRNYRNRNANLLYQETNVVHCQMQILDKLHCYFEHCYDIGNKIPNKNNTNLQHTDRKDIDNDEITQILINKQIKNQFDLLSNKPCINNEELHDRLTNKYNQLNEYVCKPHANNDDYKTYKFGQQYLYGYNDEFCRHGGVGAISVSQKYRSLKEELVSNDIFRMTVEQFGQEMTKAQIHFASYYRKKHYPKMLIEYLLSLSIYCNYTELQYHFSKTYRENDSTHSNFFHFGKNLKISLHLLGTEIGNGKLKRFYHGISEELTFPQIVPHYSSGVEIYCPLSTTSSFQVAANFTNFNKGLIVEFTGDYYEDTKYLSVSWLSDFGNEHEYLFVQNEGDLEINNITHAPSGCVFSMIITALKIIHEITKGFKWRDGITNEMISLITAIIHHQLSYNSSKYQVFNGLHTYGKKMINVYCKNKKKFDIDYLHQQEFSFLFQEFFYTKYQ